MLLLQLLLSVTCSAYVVIRDHSLASHRVKHTVLTGGGVDRVRGDGITTGLPQFRVLGSASHISLLDPQPLVASRTLGPLLAATLPTSSSSSASPPSASTLESMGGCITTEVDTPEKLIRDCGSVVEMERGSDKTLPAWASEEGLTYTRVSTNEVWETHISSKYIYVF